MKPVVYTDIHVHTARTEEAHVVRVRYMRFDRGFRRQYSPDAATSTLAFSAATAPATVTSFKDSERTVESSVATSDCLSR